MTVISINKKSDLMFMRRATASV